MTNPFNRFRRPMGEGSNLPPTGDDKDEALELLIEKARELFAQAKLYSAARVDKAKLAVRQILVALFLFVLALLSLAGLLIGASEYVLSGLAGGLTALFGIAWLGQLLAGLLIMGLVYGGYYFGMKKFEQSRIAKLKLKYEPQHPVPRPNGDHKPAEQPTYPAH